MIWIAPSEKDTDNAALEKRLWDAADQFRANSGLKSQEYSAPVLGLIFLRFAEVRFTARRAKLETPSPLTPLPLGEGKPHLFNGEWAGDIDEFERGQIGGAKIKSQSSAIGGSWFKGPR